MARVKGVFSTLAFTVIGIATLALAIMLANSVSKPEDRFTEVKKVDSVKELSNSLQETLARIFNAESNIQITKNSNKVSFIETLPLQTSLDSTLNNFQTFVTDEIKLSPTVNVSTSEITNYLTLNINPYNTTYKHSTSKDSIEILPQNSSQITNAKFEIKIQDIISALTTTNTLATGPLNLEVKITNSSGSQFYTFTKLINLTEDEKVLDIKITSTIDNKTISIITKNKKLIVNASQKQIDINTTLTATDIIDSITLPKNSVDVFIPSLEVQKSGSKDLTDSSLKDPTIDFTLTAYAKEAFEEDNDPTWNPAPELINEDPNPEVFITAQDEDVTPLDYIIFKFNNLLLTNETINSVKLSIKHKDNLGDDGELDLYPEKRVIHCCPLEAGCTPDSLSWIKIANYQISNSWIISPYKLEISECINTTALANNIQIKMIYDPYEPAEIGVTKGYIDIDYVKVDMNK